jgi:hypothetical protein
MREHQAHKREVKAGLIRKKFHSADDAECYNITQGTHPHIYMLTAFLQNSSGVGTL